LANKAVTSLGGGVYLPHWLTKKSIRSSLVGILQEKLLALMFFISEELYLCSCG